MSRPCRHISREELQSDLDMILKCGKENKPVQMPGNLSVREEFKWAKEARSAKVIRVTYAGTCLEELRQADMLHKYAPSRDHFEKDDSVTVGIDRETWAEGVRGSSRPVKSVEMWMRNNSRQLVRAEFYGVKPKRQGTRGTSEVDQAELERVLRELGE